MAIAVLTAAAAAIAQDSAPAVTAINGGVRLQAAAGTLEVTVVADSAIRVRFAPRLVAPEPDLVLRPVTAAAGCQVDQTDLRTIRVKAARIEADIDRTSGALTFRDAQGAVLLQELPERRQATKSAIQGRPTLAVQDGFVSPPDEHLFGTGQFQDGQLDVRDLPRRLTQVNTQIAIPLLVSSKGYGLLWHNDGLTELNPADEPIALTRTHLADREENVDVTTTSGTKRETRRATEFAGEFTTPVAGRYAFFLDVGRKMGRRWDVTIDGTPAIAIDNRWVPPTVGWHGELAAGRHQVVVRAEQGDRPTLRFRPAADETVLRSPVADAVDYVVFAGNPDAVIATYRQLTGAARLLPRWAFGYVHCRERFKSQAELLQTAREFRRRGLPLDLIVQDWQYWGRLGWGQPQFDPALYPDPAGMIRELHAARIRFMISVWSKIDHRTPLGRELAAQAYFIPNTDWVDYFNPAAAALYWETLRRNLFSSGVDAWWMDATEPENDDLVGRSTFAGPGELRRDLYPLYATRTVYEGQRQAAPDQRVLILTRSAFAGEQRYGAVAWSGDVGNDWDTLRRQVTAGLGYSVAGMPWWTVDGGGFFRPEQNQYTDAAYRERFIRWFQFVTFCPLQRVHGYQTDTEFWRFGDQVEGEARRYLTLRYRLLPYIYSAAARVSLAGSTLMRPLVMDFAGDERALEEKDEYLFGPALLVSPVFAPAAEKWAVYLPRSPGGWYDFWTGRRRAGGQRIAAPAPLTEIPLQVRAGSIVPLGPVLQYTDQKPADPIELRVYPGADGDFTLYEDDGVTYAYERGVGAMIPLHWDDRRQVLTIGSRTGAFPGMLTTRTFQVVWVRSGHGVGVAETEMPDASIQYSGHPVTVNRARR
ncbi:MAG TPA: TIM-barrel domain-containing protein [Opitutaceae bacterium]|nr:TIM-barrel domain-containing protein [Opitutaceae bacterium]